MDSIRPGIDLMAAAAVQATFALVDLPRQMAAERQQRNVEGHARFAYRAANAERRVARATDRRLTAALLNGDELREFAEALEEESLDLTAENIELQNQLAATRRRIAALEAALSGRAQAAR